MKMKSIAAFALAALLVAPVMAQDEAKAKSKNKKKAGGSPAMQLIKQLESVGLTEDQTKKIKEMGKASMEALTKMKEEAGITADVMKKRAEATKAVKDSGKKGKEMAAAIAEKAGLSKEQMEVFGKMNTARQKLQREVVAMLTDEQKAKLPEKMQRLMKAGGKKASGKKGGAKKKKKAE